MMCLKEFASDADLEQTSFGGWYGSNLFPQTSWFEYFCGTLYIA